jgi:hypothetical protein
MSIFLPQEELRDKCQISEECCPSAISMIWASEVLPGLLKINKRGRIM